MKLDQVLQKLDNLKDIKKVKFLEQKFAITARNSLGIYMPHLRQIAKQIKFECGGFNDKLALDLFATDIYEARLLCSMVFNPKNITDDLMDIWTASFENWGICDTFCMKFYVSCPIALEKIEQYSTSKKQFVKRAAFTMMAAYGFSNKNADNKIFEHFLSHVKAQASDDRIYVRKSVNWTLRNIGKRNPDLHKKAIICAYKVIEQDSKTAKWIGKNALLELKKTDLKFLNYPRYIYI